MNAGCAVIIEVGWLQSKVPWGRWGYTVAISLRGVWLRCFRERVERGGTQWRLLEVQGDCVVVLMDQAGVQDRHQVADVHLSWQLRTVLLGWHVCEGPTAGAQRTLTAPYSS